MQNTRPKSFIIKVIITIVALTLVLSFVIAISEHSKSKPHKENNEITIDPSNLAETKEEGFDIMEYNEYLALNRTIMFYEKDTGASYSIDSSNYWGFGEDVKLIYELIGAIIAGDSALYNEYVHKEVGHFESFTQQQIYDVSIMREERSNINDGDQAYTEYILMVEYKIHENNGSFRKDIESDASRPQYFVINNSTGTLMVMDIVPVKYVN